MSDRDVTNLVTSPLHLCHLLSPDLMECDHRDSSYEHRHHAGTQHNIMPDYSCQQLAADWLDLPMTLHFHLEQKTPNWTTRC